MLKEASKQKIASWGVTDTKPDNEPNLKMIARYSRPVRNVLKLMKKMKKVDDDQNSINKF